jgi:hypothetical protein
MPAFSLVCAPRLLTVSLRRGIQRSSTDAYASRCFGIMLIPDHLRRCCSRPVSYYALFKWWLLLSQHPGCRGRITSYRTKLNLGTLAGDQGCFPFDREDYPSRTHSRDSLCGIRSLIGACRRVAPRLLSVALPPQSSGSRLPLKAFRREPDISPFD